MGDFDACRFDFRIDTKNGLMPSRRRKYNYNTFFNCKVCGKLFDTRPRLLVHKLVHNEYRCTGCAQSFPRRAALKEHIAKAHPGAKVQCELVYTCNKAATEPPVPPQTNFVLSPSHIRGKQAPKPAPPPTAAAVAPPATSTVESQIPGGYMCFNMPLMVCSPQSQAAAYSAPLVASPSVASTAEPLYTTRAVISSMPYTPTVQYVQQAIPAFNTVVPQFPAAAANPTSLGQPNFVTPPIFSAGQQGPATAPLLTPLCSCEDDLEPGEIRRPKPCCHNLFPAASQGLSVVSCPLPLQYDQTTENQVMSVSQPPAMPQYDRNAMVPIKMEPTEEQCGTSTMDDTTMQPQTTPLIISRLPNGEHKVTVKQAVDNVPAEAPSHRCEMCGFPGSSTKQLAEHACPGTDHRKETYKLGDLVAKPMLEQVPQYSPRSHNCRLCGFGASSVEALEQHNCQPPSSLNRTVDRLWQTKTNPDVGVVAVAQSLAAQAAPTVVREPVPRPVQRRRKRQNDYCTIKFHTCKFCRQLFNSAKEMRDHVVTHEDYLRKRYHASRRTGHAGRRSRTNLGVESNPLEEKERLTCVYNGCSVSVIGYNALLQHVEQEHLEQASSKAVSQAEKRMLFTVEGGDKPSGRLGCEFPGCRRRFTDWRQLKQHLSAHVKEMPLACSLCAYACRHRSSMNWHMKSKHSLDKMKTQGNRTVYVDASGNVVDGGGANTTLNSNVSEQPNHSTDDVAQHSVKAEPRERQKTEVLNDSPNNADSQALIGADVNRTESVAQYTSGMQNTTLQQMSVDNQEETSFIDENDEPIDMTMKKLSSANSVPLNEGTEQNVLTTLDCELHTSSRPALARHIRRTHIKRKPSQPHTNVRPLACHHPGCTRRFREAKHLRVHAMQHTDERPLHCEMCDYACRQRNSMNWHMKSRHQLYKHVMVNGKTVYS